MARLDINALKMQRHLLRPEGQIFVVGKVLKQQAVRAAMGQRLNFPEINPGAVETSRWRESDSKAKLDSAIRKHVFSGFGPAREMLKASFDEAISKGDGCKGLEFLLLKINENPARFSAFGHSNSSSPETIAEIFLERVAGKCRAIGKASLGLGLAQSKYEKWVSENHPELLSQFGGKSGNALLLNTTDAFGHILPRYSVYADLMLDELKARREKNGAKA